jgi:hypothetical protein
MFKGVAHPYAAAKLAPPVRSSFQLPDFRQEGVAASGELGPSVLEAFQDDHVALTEDVLAQAVSVCAAGLRAFRAQIVLRVAGRRRDQQNSDRKCGREQTGTRN